MAHPLYPNFATDETDYLALNQLWQATLEQCLPTEEQSSWVPWLAADRDGNPIFSVRHREKPRGFSIHQDTAPEDASYFAIVHRTFDERGTTEGPIDHLVILCTPSEETLPRARQTIREFVRKD